MAIINDDLRPVFIMLCFLFGCKAPFPSDTSVYKSEKLRFQRFKPIMQAKYEGDSLHIKDFLILKGRTASYLSEREHLEVNEDSILLKFAKILTNSGVKFKLDENRENIFNSGLFFDPSNKTVINGIEKNVDKAKFSNSNSGNRKFLIPAFVFRNDHDASSFAGPGEVMIRYFVTFMVFIYTEENEIIYKNERSISAKSESIEHWEEALAFPIEERVTEEHFEEMIREALRDYLE